MAWAPHPLWPYPSPEQREARLTRLAEAAGGTLGTIGESVEGRPLRLVRLPALSAGQAARPPLAKFLVLGNIHGPEYVSGAVALGLLERLDRLQAVRVRAEIVVLPCLNPDGYARVWQRAGAGRIEELRPNAHGVDLNRNFPLPTGQKRRAWPGAGSTQPGAATYVGPAPLSEPESAALARFCAAEGFTAAVSCHSFMGTVIPAHVADGAAFAHYRQLCQSLAEAQPRVGYARLAARHLDTFTGELEDFLHHHLGTWAVCLETFPIWASFQQHLRAPSLFWRFNPREPGPWIDNDVAGIAGYFAAALALPGRPQAPARPLYEAAAAW